MKVLVTGACGQLGHTMMKQSAGSVHEFIYTARHPLADGTTYLDVTDEEAVDKIISDNGVQVIVNCAGYTDVAKAETDEAAAFKVNSDAVAVLAEAVEKAGAVLIHISTDYVYDGKSSVPYSEEMVPAPLNAYGRSKLAGENAIIGSGCRYIIIRTSWLYSGYGRNFVQTIRTRSSEQPVLHVVDDQIGTPTYAGDLADFILHIIEEDKLDNQGIYNYSNEGVCSWYDFAHEICELTGSLCEVLPCKSDEYPSNVRRPSFSVMDKSKVKKVFGVGIPHWKDSLRFFLFG